MGALKLAVGNELTGSEVAEAVGQHREFRQSCFQCSLISVKK
jgi:hypothetical protein